jgi:bifunctional DNase/RNase
MDLIRCSIHGVFLSVTESGSAPTVVLDVGEGSCIPVYIGLWEAISIGNALNKDILPRPITHDLFIEVLKNFSISIEALQIDSLDEGIYYAKMILTHNSTRQIIDCRPSDGIAIALRAGAPILIDREVVDAAAVKRENLPKVVDLHNFI